METVQMEARLRQLVDAARVENVDEISTLYAALAMEFRPRLVRSVMRLGFDEASAWALVDDAITDGLSRLHNQVLEANTLDPSADFGGSGRNLTNFHWSGDYNLDLEGWLKRLIGKYNTPGILSAHVRRLQREILMAETPELEPEEGGEQERQEQLLDQLLRAVRKLDDPQTQLVVTLSHGVHREVCLDQAAIKRLAIAAGFKNRESSRMARRVAERSPGGDLHLTQKEIASLLEIGDRYVRTLLRRGEGELRSLVGDA